VVIGLTRGEGGEGFQDCKRGVVQNFDLKKREKGLFGPSERTAGLD